MTDHRIETFRSSLDELYTTMDSAWAADYRREPRLDYTAEFLRWHFSAPGVDPELLVAAYDGDRIIGFGSSFPRQMVLRGQQIRTSLSTFFTVHEGYRRQRLGWRLVEERLRRNREKGFQCFFVYLQEGHASQPLYERLGRETGVRVEKVFVSCFRVRMLDPARLSARAREFWTDDLTALPEPRGYGGKIRPLRPADLPRCREILNGIQRTVPLARVWTSHEELGWQLHHPPFSECLVLENEGEIRGLSNWFTMDRIAKTRDRVALLDSVWLADLDEAQAFALTLAALTRMRDQGCLVANLSSPPYFDESPLQKLGFVDTETLLNLYAVVLDPDLDFSGLDQIYLDQR